MRICLIVTKLLEAVFGTFDEVARRKKVFKVETVGECYGKRPRFSELFHFYFNWSILQNVSDSISFSFFDQSLRYWGSSQAKWPRSAHGRICPYRNEKDEKYGEAPRN